MRIFFTEEFKKRYNELPRIIQKKADKQQLLFRVNPFHPSLNTEKLAPKARAIWTFRVDLRACSKSKRYHVTKISRLPAKIPKFPLQIAHPSSTYLDMPPRASRFSQEILAFWLGIRF